MATADSIFKFCRKCQTETERNASGDCKLCNKAKFAAWQAANPDRKKATDAAWRAANPDRHKANSAAWSAANKERVKSNLAAWYVANPERVKAAAAVWGAANPERVKASKAAWRAANPEAVCIYQQNYRAYKRENGGVLSQGLSAKLFKLQRGLCPCCNQPLGDNFHLDHTLPIALGGPNVDDNMQLLRQRCNNQKSAKHPVEFMQSRGFLL